MNKSTWNKLLITDKHASTVISYCGNRKELIWEVRGIHSWVRQRSHQISRQQSTHGICLLLLPLPPITTPHSTPLAVPKRLADISRITPLFITRLHRRHKTLRITFIRLSYACHRCFAAPLKEKGVSSFQLCRDRVFG